MVAKQVWVLANSVKNKNPCVAAFEIIRTGNFHRRVDAFFLKDYGLPMKAVEFLTELSGKPVLMIPQDMVGKLPKSGRARVIVLTGKDADEAEWRKNAYEQFMREDSPDDSVCDNCF